MIESVPATSTTARVWQALPSVRVARKGALALSIKLAGAGLALALQISLARVLGQSGYGEYAYVFAWLQLGLMFGHGGFAIAALRYVAEYRARRHPELLRGFLRRSAQLVGIESVTVALFMVGCALVWNHAETAGSVQNFVIAGVALPVVSYLALSCAVVRGLGHVLSSMLATLVQPGVLLVALLATAYLFRFDVSSTEALMLHLGAAVCALGVVISLQRRLELSSEPASQCSFLTSEWLATATQMMFTSGFVFLQARSGVIITGLLLDADAAGTYAAVERLGDATLLGLVSVNMLAAPKFAALHAQGRLHELQRYARLSAWGATMFLLATVVPLVLFGKPILQLFGDAFVYGYPALLILLGGVAVNAMCGPVGILLNMTGHHRAMLLVAFCCLSINLTLSLILTPRHGIVGTSVAVAVAMAVWNIAILLIVRRRLGIWACIGHGG